MDARLFYHPFSSVSTLKIAISFTFLTFFTQFCRNPLLHTDSFVVVVCLWGEANINGIRVKQGETLLVPASENVLYIFGNATFLTATM